MTSNPSRIRWSTTGQSPRSIPTLAISWRRIRVVIVVRPPCECGTVACSTRPPLSLTMHSGCCQDQSIPAQVGGSLLESAPCVSPWNSALRFRNVTPGRSPLFDKLLVLINGQAGLAATVDRVPRHPVAKTGLADLEGAGGLRNRVALDDKSSQGLDAGTPRVGSRHLADSSETIIASTQVAGKAGQASWPRRMPPRQLPGFPGRGWCSPPGCRSHGR